MRSRIETIKAVKAREDAEKERQHKLAAFQTSPSSSADASVSASASHVASATKKPSSSFTGLIVQIVAVSVLLIGLIFGTNEAMVILLK